MSRVGLLRKSLRDYRVAMVAIAVLNFGIALMDILIYPSYRDALGDMDLPSGFEGFLGEAESLASPEGFITAEFFAWIPLVLITLAIIAGTAALAGEEGAGTMDLLLAQPIRRWRLVVERAAGIALLLAIPALAGWPGFLLGKAFVEFELGGWALLIATLNMLPLVFLFLGIALFTSALLANRGAAAGITVGLLVLAFFVNTLASAVASLDAFRKLTPFYWSDASYVFVHGFSWLRFLGLLAPAIAFVALAAWRFERRDVSLGGREWKLFSLFRRRQREPEQPPARPGQPEPTAGGD